MLVFDAAYDKHHPGKQSYNEFIHSIVVSNTKEEALTLLSIMYEGTDIECWTLDEIDMSTPKVHHLYSEESG